MCDIGVCCNFLGFRNLSPIEMDRGPEMGPILVVSNNAHGTCVIWSDFP